ncbi:succinylglutamate desuccinylase/aspartoacylase domain-containing protein [Paenibacillus sp. MMO-177]|uniref:succinylglutamate desuccinylase/aspartoacylase domain-containing protein n=1 Tax=Paenibacillus sp. MMO-177 TaxID=3081289 RepID=UPI003017EB74
MQITKQLLAKSSEHETPYYIVNGVSQGSTVMVTAGIHGTERAGFLSAKKLVELLQRDIIHVHSGRLIIIPIVNQVAVRKKIRGVPDLNRTFPKHNFKSASHPLSRAVFELAREQQPVWYVDLHEANGLSGIHPRSLGQTLIVNPRSKAIPAAKRMIRRLNTSIEKASIRFSLLQRELPGSGRSAAYHLLHSNAITVETGIGLPLKLRISYQMNILRSILREAGLLKRRRESQNSDKLK